METQIGRLPLVGNRRLTIETPITVSKKEYDRIQGWISTQLCIQDLDPAPDSHGNSYDQTSVSRAVNPPAGGVI